MEPLEHVQAYVAFLLSEFTVCVGADGGSCRAFHCGVLFQLPWPRAAIVFPQGQLSLTLNFFLSAVLLAFNLGCSAFINVKSMKGEQFIKLASRLSLGKTLPMHSRGDTWQTHLNSVKVF